MAFYDFLNIIFAPLLKLPTAMAIIIMAFLISLIIIIITKFTTDQTLMKKLKEEIKEYQNQSKQLKDNPSKAMEVQKKAMEVNMKYMTHSLRPTLITFIPIILIFGWMSSTFAYESIKPLQEFTITAVFDKNINGNSELIVPDGITLAGNGTQKIENEKATWALKGTEGDYILEINYGAEKLQKTILITNGKKYIESVKKYDGSVKSIQINYRKLVVIPIGFKDWLGWLGTYIWSSIIFTMILRKTLKVY